MRDSHRYSPLLPPLSAKIQRRKSRTLAQWLQSCENREQALYNAHTHSAMTMSAIARELGLSISRVSRLIARAGGFKFELHHLRCVGHSRRLVV